MKKGTQFEDIQPPSSSGSELIEKLHGKRFHAIQNQIHPPQNQTKKKTKKLVSCLTAFSQVPSPNEINQIQLRSNKDDQDE